MLKIHSIILAGSMFSDGYEMDEINGIVNYEDKILGK